MPFTLKDKAGKQIPLTAEQEKQIENVLLQHLAKESGVKLPQEWLQGGFSKA
jgi:hypothetical protein